MKNELGEGAIILHSKNVKATDSGDDIFEITAAIDDDPIETNPVEKKSGEIIPELNTLANLRRIAEKFQNIREEKSNDLQYQDSPTEILNIKNDLSSVKGALGEIADRLKSDKLPELPRILRNFYDIMTQNEVEEKSALDLVYEINEMGTKFEVPEEAIRNILMKKIADRITVAPAMKLSKKETKIISFIGSTGVGKTTTICKVAAICKYFNHYNIAIISIDTYRLAAIDQLKTFTEIANIPLEIAYNSAELKEQIDKHKDKDVIFIDTVGRSPNNSEHIAEIKSFIESIPSDEVHLIISASTSFSNMKEVVRKFGEIMPNRLVISKVDEAVNYGNIFNIIEYSKLPISYITTGQVIPDDIEIADKSKIAGHILKAKESDEWTN